MSKQFSSLEERRKYNRDHYRVNRVHGKASEYLCDECGGDAKEWAHLHDTDPSNPDNYSPMCRLCHQRYDNRWNDEERAKVSATLKKIGHLPPLATGMKRSEETKRRMSEAQIDSWARRKGVAP